MTCFFIGHRDAPDTILPQLREVIEHHITAYGVTEFIVGHYGHFDALAAHAVRDVKQRYPAVNLVLLLPYYPYEHLEGYDRSFYPPGMETVPKPFAIIRANQYMIRNSDFLICYCKGYVGNTQKLVELARRLEKRGLIHVENLAKEIPGTVPNLH